MNKIAAALLFSVAGSSAFTVPNGSTRVNSAVQAFAGGMVGNEGPEPMPFTTAGSSKDFDPAGFAEVSPFSSLSCTPNIVIVFFND